MRRIISLILTSAIAVSQCSFAFANEQTDAAAASNFEVQQSEVIEISNADDLKAAAAAVKSDADGCKGVYYKLVNDIDLKNEIWSDYIGFYHEMDGAENEVKPFRGTFDGNGHVIKNYRLSCDYKIAAGIFGALGENAVVKNLGTENVTISIDKDWVWAFAGGMAGYIESDAKISDCYVKSVYFTTGVQFFDEKMEFSNAGGIVGKAVGGNIENSYALDVSIDSRPGREDSTIAGMFGGIAGFIQQGTAIRNCYTNLYIAPSTKTGTTVENSYYTVTPGWPWNTGDDENYMYLGTQISDDEIKNISITLGNSFADDPRGLINNGYPILLWEQGTKFSHGEAQIVSSTPQDQADNVSAYNCSVSIVFDKFIDFDTLDEDSIIVEPSAKVKLDKKDAIGSERVEMFLVKLKNSTTYTISFKDSVKTIMGDNIAADTKLSFTTASADTGVGLTNLVQNGDMEDTSNLAVFKHSNPATEGHISFMYENELKGKRNSVLHLQPGWEGEPVLANNSVTKPGKYYMSAWIKSYNKQNVGMAIQSRDNATDEIIWTSEANEFPADKWTFMACELDLTSNMIPEEISIRANGGKPISVDEWSIYDISEAPSEDVSVVDCNIENDAEGISPISPVFEVWFNVPVRQGTLTTGISLINSKGEKQPVDTEFSYGDLLNCKINCGDILPGESYTLDFGGVKSIAGKSVINGSIAFKTIAGNGKNADVISVYPASGAKEIKQSDLPIIIEFDEPINSKTIGNIKVSPDLGAVPEMSFLDPKRCSISIDESKFKNGVEYTVTVPETVKTIDGFKTNEYSFKFTAISDEGIIKILNDALGDADAVKKFFENNYHEMGSSCAVYDYLSENRKDILNEFFELAAKEEKFVSVDDLCKRINACAFKVIDSNVSDIEEIKSVTAIKNGILDDKVLNIYTTILDEKSRNAVIGRIMKEKSLTPMQLESKLIEDVICTALRISEGSNVIRKILKDTQEYFTGGDDISSLIKTAESSTFPTKIYGSMSTFLKNASAYAQVKTALQRAIQDSTPASSRPSGGSSSSGSGGGGGNVVYNPVKSENQPSETHEENVIFGDLDGVSWAKDSIIGLYNQGIINGRNDKIFAPNENLTRSEFAKIVILATGTADETAMVDFKDINTEHWAYKYIASAYHEGIIQGISDELFGAEMPIIRQDIAVMLDRIAKQQKIETDSISLDFSDYKEISDYAAEAVGHLAYIGVINGRDDNSFAPNDTATRAEAAVIIDRFLEFLKSRKGE